MTKGMSQWQAGSDLYDKAISGSPYLAYSMTVAKRNTAITPLIHVTQTNAEWLSSCTAEEGALTAGALQCC